MHSNRSVLMKYAPLLIAIYVLTVFIFMNDWGTVESSEARYAEIAREMLISGDWIHPQLMNIHHYHKPPFTYWITAVSYSLFGINTFAARFFLAVSVLIQLVLIYRIADYFLKDKDKAFAAALVYATIPLLIVSMRGLTTDAYLQTFILFSVYFFIQWRTKRQPRWLYLIALAGGFGFLTKGPLVLILPVFFLIGFFKILPKTSFTYHHFFSSLLFIAIGFSWFIYLIIENSEFISYFLFRHTYERVANASVFSRKEPFWYYIAYTPLVALPWTMVLISGFVKSKWREMPGLLKKVVIFMVILPLTFFSISSSKLILYVLPAFPGIAILTAYFLFEIDAKSKKENYLLAYFTLLCLSFYVIDRFDKSINIPFELLIPPLLTVSILFALRAVKSLSNIDRIMLSTFVFTLFLLGYGARFMKSNELKINSTSPLAAWIQEQHLEDKNILVYNRLLPSLSFNLNRDIISLHDGDRYLKREVNFEKDDQWKNGLYDLTVATEADRLLPVLQDAPIMLVKGEVQPSSQWLLKYFPHHHKKGDWLIYY